MTNQEPIDYKDTINLPKTAFPMAGKLPTTEPARLEKWAQMELREQILAKTQDRPVFSLLDGPPYANGDIHIGHALNKILKDVVLRYKTMSGHHCYYVPGFDCHGLPIETKVMNRLKGEAQGLPASEIRRHCHDEAIKWVGHQTEQFKRLGVNADWDHAYHTLDPDVEVGILSALRDMVQRGYVHKNFKPVLWDPVYRTALAEAEIEYETHTSDSIYVKFPLNDAEKVPALAGLANVSVVIWTTTPWTLPANLGVCLHAEFDYVALAVGGEHYIVAKELVESFCKACKIEGATVAATLKGPDLERMTCKHPIFEDKTSLIILGDHVTLETGTGCVHTAPGHGVDDFNVGRRYGLGVFVPVDEAGRYTDEYPEMVGLNVFKANEPIVEKLGAAGLLLGHMKYEHQYPHSWRSHKPVIFRATEQWFIELDGSGIREKALNAIDNDVRWIPSWGRDRIFNMVQQRPEWCLSRQRVWGVPIPSLRSKKTGQSILDVRVIERLMELAKEQGTDAWFTQPVEAFLPEGFVYEPTGEASPEDFEKEFDTVDIWFDSGSLNIAVPAARPGILEKSALYLEGADQHRGWFQSSLLISIGTRDRAPFEAVLTHGFVMDGKGEAMSKSKGNVIAPKEILSQIGADGLRLWVVSEDYRSDVTISENILKHTGEAYRRIRNTFRFLLGNLADFDPAKDMVPFEQLEEFDQWNLGLLNNLIKKVTEVYENYEFHRIFHLVHNFCSVTLSARYLDVTKDRLYCSAPGDLTRRAAQTTCYHMLDYLVRMLAPVLVFTTEEVWEAAGLFEQASVHLADFPKPVEEWDSIALNEKWNQLLELRGDVSRILEEKRRDKVIGHSLEARVELKAQNEQDQEFLRNNLAILKNLFIVSDVQLTEGIGPQSQEREIVVSTAPGKKCERCWIIDPQVGADTQHPGLCPRCADVMKRI